MVHKEALVPGDPSSGGKDRALDIGLCAQKGLTAGDDWTTT